MPKTPIGNGSYEDKAQLWTQVQIGNEKKDSMTAQRSLIAPHADAIQLRDGCTEHGIVIDSRKPDR